MSSKKEEIRCLRKQNMSYLDISKKLGVSKSIISYHCQDLPVDKSVFKERMRLNGLKASACNKAKWDHINAGIVKKAKHEWLLVRKNPELMGFLGIYWGEGAKSIKVASVLVANSDPALIKLSVKYIKKLCVNKHITARVTYYDDMDVDACKKTWEDTTGLSVKMKLKGKKKPNLKGYSKFGTCYVQCSDKAAMLKISTWLELWRQSIRAPTQN